MAFGALGGARSFPERLPVAELALGLLPGLPHREPGGVESGKGSWGGGGSWRGSGGGH